MNTSNTDTEKAIQWWKELDSTGQLNWKLAIKYYGAAAHPGYLTDGQIQFIWDEKNRFMLGAPKETSAAPSSVEGLNAAQEQISINKILDEAAMRLFLAHNPKTNPFTENEINKRLIAGFRTDMEILSLFFDIPANLLPPH